jgi:uncharacterized membrane protein
MKKVLAFLVTALALVGAGYYLGSKRTAEQAGQMAATEAGWQNEKAFLEQALAEAKRKQVEVRTVTRTTSTTVTNKLSAQEILDKLLKLNPSMGEEARNRIFRQIVHHLQMLADLGTEAAPVIQAFLRENKDVDYVGEELNESGERVRSGFTSRYVARTDFLVPPSLRLGLVDVLDQIGGEEAEAVLAEVLDTTGRGVEVAYIARVLEETNPGKYRDNALKAAKELLMNPPSINLPNRIDDNARAYLYQVLAMYRDTSFAQSAHDQLIMPDGRVDRQALGYLSNTLKEQGVPALSAAYKDQRLTNQNERTHIQNAILAFTGPSAEANELFKQIISDEKVPSSIRSYAIVGLAGGAGRERPFDPQLIQSRLTLLHNFRSYLKDEKLLKSIDDTKIILEQILARQTAKQ